MNKETTVTELSTNLRFKHKVSMPLSASDNTIIRLELGLKATKYSSNLNIK